MRELYDTSHGKFNCPMAHYLWERSMDGGDDSTGNVDSPIGYVTRIGRWLVQEDNCGFVNAAKYPTRDAAKAELEEMKAIYCAWDDDVDDDGPEWSVVDDDNHYTHPKWPGVALRVFAVCPGTDWVKVYMVGDDREYTVERRDLQVVPGACPSCGQVGCPW